MMKKVLTLAAAAGLALTLAACGGPVEQLPTLAMPGSESSAQPAGSGVSGAAESSSVSGAPESQAPERILDTEFEDTLDGLCEYLEKNYAVAGDKTEMSYKEIGAVGGYRYKFMYNGSTVQAEVYEFDLQNLDEKGQECLDSVKAEGKFKVLDNEVPATLNASGKYLMIYTDTKDDAVNTAQRERVQEIFQAFKASGK